MFFQLHFVAFCSLIRNIIYDIYLWYVFTLFVTSKVVNFFISFSWSIICNRVGLHPLPALVLLEPHLQFEEAVFVSISMSFLRNHYWKSIFLISTIPFSRSSRYSTLCCWEKCFVFRLGYFFYMFAQFCWSPFFPHLYGILTSILIVIRTRNSLLIDHQDIYSCVVVGKVLRFLPWIIFLNVDTVLLKYILFSSVLYSVIHFDSG